MSRASVVCGDVRRQSRPVQGLAGSSAAKEASLTRVNPAAQELLEAVSPLSGALLPEPAQREVSAVQQALDWWLDSLPGFGAQLAPELEAPGDVLLNVFSRGRLAVCAKGDKLQGEGEEARHYTIVLVGSCRLRCRAPVPKTTAPPARGKGGKVKEDVEKEDEDGLAAALDEDGAVHVGHVRRGEAIGLTPGEPRAPWEVVCAEHTAVLMLGAEDYAATLRPFHKQLQADTVRFLQERSVCPQATPQVLQRFAGQLRRRCLRRGTVLLAAGELQRQIFILRDGSLSILAPPQQRLPGEGEGDLEEEAADECFTQDEEIGREIQRRERLRHYSMEGGAKQLQGAADEARDQVLKRHARGALGKILRGEKNAKPQNNLGVAARKDGLVPTAIVSEPGTLVGEEVLLYDTFRELAVARNCYTVIANEDCTCLAVDVTAFQKLGSLVGAETLLEKTKEKLSRHMSQHVHCKRSAMQMAKDVRRYKMREMHRQERQTLKLPPCYQGAVVLDALESTNDWLPTVLAYRKPPPNERTPGTLNCLTTLALDPCTFQSGPGVGAMLQVFRNPAELSAMRDGLRYRKIGAPRADCDRNPMGDIVQKDARYADARPPSPSAVLQALPPAESPEELDSGMGGVFFCTEVDEAALPERLGEVSPGRGAASDGFSVQAIVRSSSVPVLPRIPSSNSWGAAATTPEVVPALPFDGRGSMKRSGSIAGMKPSASRKGGGGTHEAIVAKTFYRTVQGKSVLLLTDKAETRRAVMKGVQSSLTEFELVFVKTGADFLTRLNSSKDTYHALILDLAKSEFQADALLRTVRQHQRYGRLPILVLSVERELTDTVRSSCSFVVFHPVAAPMLREGLLWCLDKKALLAKGGRSEAVAGEASPEAVRGLGMGGQAHFALLAQPAPIAVA